MSSEHILSFAVAALCVVMLLSGLNSLDARTGMERIIRASEAGVTKVKRARFLIMSAAVLLAFLCISVPEYIRLYRIDQFSCISARFSDFVPRFFPDNVSIKTVVLLVSLLRLIMLYAVGGAALRLTRYFRNEMIPVVLLIGIILVVSVFGMLFSLDLTTIVLKIFGITFV